VHFFYFAYLLVHQLLLIFVAHTLDAKMPTPLRKAARYRAHAATSLVNAEAAGDDATRRAHLAIAKHFYLLAEEEIGQREEQHRVSSD
jgi:hypothetical protein